MEWSYCAHTGETEEGGEGWKSRLLNLLWTEGDLPLPIGNTAVRTGEARGEMAEKNLVMGNDDERRRRG